ncbi:MAG: phosphate/phosphite/phosphonate ABC transporter substrate-binding protein [Sulfuriferula multivorans]|uniref:Phosphate/phosphite/phosphonate ABC transporter substrate-binding protein n=1 Tax=Sulfuriferula multivorans TaxID=1559896 RepID=A0A7C9KA23_9PROT|nr:phosphate/phosphite/phosphonate ABC transporter substrate-binding protein [Sulfuriferula multivorans]
MRSVVALFFLVCHVGFALAAPGTTIRVGVLPTLSAKVLLTNYQPLRVYLERELQRPVEMVTSTDFKRFQHDTLAGDFDLLVTAPHLARLSQMEAGFLPVATYLAANRPVLITAKNKPIKQLEELLGRNIAIFDSLGLIVVQAQQWLEDRGFEQGRDYRTMLFPSHNSVGFSVQQGESLMGIISPAGLRQLPPEILENIQVFAELPQVPALIWIVHPRLKQEADRIQAALLRFAETPEGAQFYSGNAYKGMRPVTPEELRSLDRSAREVKRLIQGLP